MSLKSIDFGRDGAVIGSRGTIHYIAGSQGLKEAHHFEAVGHTLITLRAIISGEVSLKSEADTFVLLGDVSPKTRAGKTGKPARSYFWWPGRASKNPVSKPGLAILALAGFGRVRASSCHCSTKSAQSMEQPRQPHTTVARSQPAMPVITRASRKISGATANLRALH